MHKKQSWLNWRRLIIDDRELSHGAKSIGLYLNTYMNDSHDMAFPSIKRICGEMNLSNKTAIKYLAELAEMGYLQKQKRFSSSTVYHATIPRSVESTLMEDLHHRSVEFTPTEVENLHSNKQENNQSNNQVNIKGPPFSEFWKAYPNKQGKSVAEKKWSRLLPADRELAIIDCQSRYQDIEKEFIPHGSTYLNQRRWEDSKPVRKSNGISRTGIQKPSIADEVGRLVEKYRSTGDG